MKKYLKYLLSILKFGFLGFIVSITIWILTIIVITSIMDSDSVLLQQTILVLGELVEFNFSTIIILFSSIGAFIGLFIGIKKEKENFNNLQIGTLNDKRKLEINLEKKYSYAIKDFLITMFLFIAGGIVIPLIFDYTRSGCTGFCGLGFFITVFTLGLIVSTIFAIIRFSISNRSKEKDE